MKKGDYIYNDSLEIKVTDTSFQIKKLEDVDIFLKDVLLGDVYLCKYVKENDIEKYKWYRLIKDIYENKIKLIKLGPEDEYINYVIDVYEDYETIKKIVWQFKNEINNEIKERGSKK